MTPIQLPTGNTIYVSSYEYYFILKEEDVHLFFQSCIADDLGVYVADPFSHAAYTQGTLELEVEDVPDDSKSPDDFEI